LAADFLALTGDFLAAFFFAALGMCLHLSVLCRAVQLSAAARLGLNTIIDEFLQLAIRLRRLLARGRKFLEHASSDRRDPTRAAQGVTRTGARSRRARRNSEKRLQNKLFYARFNARAKCAQAAPRRA
jgi:hypothetical protein